MKVLRTAWLACVAAAALGACGHPSSVSRQGATRALRFSADADSAGVTVAAFDGTVRFAERRVVVHIEAGTFSQSWVPGTLTLCYARQEPSGGWRVVATGAAVAPSRWVLRPGMVWVPLDLDAPLPRDDGTGTGDLVLILERRRPDLPVSSPELWYVPLRFHL